MKGDFISQYCPSDNYDEEILYISRINQNVRCFDTHSATLKWNYTLSSVSFNYKTRKHIDNSLLIVYPEISVSNNDIKAIDTVYIILYLTLLLLLLLLIV